MYGVAARIDDLTLILATIAASVPRYDRAMPMSRRQRRSTAPSVTIASRIFWPEPAAASFRLKAVADALANDGAAVTVLTSTFEDAPKRQRIRGGRVLRWPVLRDKTGYLRGYVPYMSFDVPLFIRLLFSKRPDVVLVEPPPTTGFFSRLACFVRGVPYVWYAADIWSDALIASGASKPVVSVVRLFESFTAKGATGVITVTDGCSKRITELGAKNVLVIPNGIDTSVYNLDAKPLSAIELGAFGITGPYMIYTGTASEWQEAEVFAEAMNTVARKTPDLQAVFVGQGTRWEKIEEISGRLKNRFGREVVVQIPPQDPAMVARLLRGADLAMVSLVPGIGYDMAYPTKVVAAVASGTPVLFAGAGPAVKEIQDNHLGITVEHDPDVIAEAVLRMIPTVDRDFDAEALHSWAEQNRSLEALGRKASAFILSQIRR